MSKMQMINQMKENIKADPALDVSEWQNTLHFKAGELEKMELVDLNPIEIKGMPERKEGDLTAVEMAVVSAAQCYATTLHMLAYNEDISLDEVSIIFTGKFARAPFLDIKEGNSGLTNPSIEVSITSSASAEKLDAIAKKSVELSPVLQSLKEKVELVIK